MSLHPSSILTVHESPTFLDPVWSGLLTLQIPVIYDHSQTSCNLSPWHYLSQYWKFHTFRWQISHRYTESKTILPGTISTSIGNFTYYLQSVFQTAHWRVFHYRCPKTIRPITHCLLLETEDWGPLPLIPRHFVKDGTLEPSPEVVIPQPINQKPHITTIWLLTLRYLLNTDARLSRLSTSTPCEQMRC